MINALADSGFIYSVLDAGEKQHTQCAALLNLRDQRIYLPVITLPEVVFLVRRNTKNPALIPMAIRALRQPPWNWLNPELTDYDRAADIMEQYKDAKLDLVDCVIAAIAERMNIQRILTLDQRDFSIIKPRNGSAFEIRPA
jgi:uncharacterized protein